MCVLGKPMRLSDVYRRSKNSFMLLVETRFQRCSTRDMGSGFKWQFKPLITQYHSGRTEIAGTVHYLRCNAISGTVHWRAAGFSEGALVGAAVGRITAGGRSRIRRGQGNGRLNRGLDARCVHDALGYVTACLGILGRELLN